MRNDYSRKRQKQLAQYFRCLSSVCTDSLLGYYYIPYEFHFTERWFRNHMMKQVLGLWNITDAASLKRKIRWLLDDGYRAEYREVHAKLAALTEVSRRNYIDASREESDFASLVVVHQHLPQLPSGEIAAFGCGWAIFLSRIGLVYRYLTEDEAWELKLEAARLVQRHYRSWAEFFIAFSTGSQYFKLFMDMKRYPDAINRSNSLLGGSTLIWKKALWDQDLRPDKGQANQRQQEASV